LSVAEAADGRALVKCHSGCAVELVLSALKLDIRDLFPDADRSTPSKLSKRAHGDTHNNGRVFPTLEKAIEFYGRTLGKPVAVWHYRNASNAIIAAVARWDLADGKTIRPFTLFGGAWRCEAPRPPRPLFNLPALLATGPADWVGVVEGEKSADAVLACGLVGTTSSGGAAAPHLSDWSPIRGRRCVILPDNDGPGREYAKTVAKLCLESGAAEVKTLDLGQYAPRNGRDIAPDHGGRGVASSRRPRCAASGRCCATASAMALA